MANFLGILPSFRKYLLTYLIFSLVVFGVFFIAASGQTERTALRELEFDSMMMARVFPGDISRIQLLLNSLPEEGGRFTAVYSMDGRLIGSSDSNLLTGDAYPDKTIVLSDWRCGVVKKLVEGGFLSVLVPICGNDKPFAVIKNSISVRSLDVEKIRTGVTFLFIYLFVGVLFLLMLARFSMKFNQMESGLVRSIAEIEGGNINVNTMRFNRTEWQGLAQSLSSMAVTLNERLSRLMSDKEWLEAAVSSIRGGLLVINHVQKIVLANDQMKEIIGGNSPEGRFYWEVIRDLNLLNSIEKITNGKNHLVEEQEIQNKTYLANLSVLGKSGGLAVILYDITESKNLEKIKKDFVANVSHELKTPLTAIKGFVEALQEGGDRNDQKRYLDIIIRNTDRLSRIINDLLTLSEMEEKGIPLELEKVDIPELLNRVVKLFADQYQGKGLSLELLVDQSIHNIKADGFRLEQLFINLIDNAFKYTEKGGTKIYAAVIGNRAQFEVADTGMGIPEKDLPRLFERFYVVDKSRSRSQGGTGLGLSIVKHIVMLHHGEIDVKSTLGVGTRFIIRLPLEKEGTSNE